MVQQSEAFLIGHRGEGVIRVDFLQAGDQVSQRVVGSKGVHLSDDRQVRNTRRRNTLFQVQVQVLTESCRSFQPPIALNCLNCSLSMHLPIILSR